MHTKSLLRGPLRVTIAFLLVLTMIVPSAMTAAALDVTDTLLYKGTNTDTKVLLDTGLAYVDGCDHGLLAVNEDDPTSCLPDYFPGTAWFRVQAGVKYTVITAQSANFRLMAPDSFRQDTTSPFSTTLTTTDVDGKELKLTATPFIEFDVAYDAPLANCPKDTITTIAELNTATTSGCLDAVYRSGQVDIATLTLLQKDTTLPYSGTSNLSQTASTERIDIGTFVGLPPGSLEVGLDFTTNLALTAGSGFTATRVISSSSNPGEALVSSTISWPNGNPQQDNVYLPCSIPAGDNLVYKLTNNKWAGTAAASETITLVIEIVDPVPDISIDIGTVTLFNGLEVVSSANDYSRVLGEVLSENKPPTVALGTIPTDGKEGAPVQLSVVGTGPGGSFDNCDPTGVNLSFHWLFDDGGEAYGKSVYHVYPDNAGSSPRTGHVEVRDVAANVTDRDFSVAVANVAPTVGAGPNRTSYWGVPVAFQANGSDQGSIDNQSLLYNWDFNDLNSPVGASGQNVSHLFSQPGAYNVEVTVGDKDGASSSDTVEVNVIQRGSSTAYTGQAQSGPNQWVTLTAQVTDNFGQAVVGRTVSFQLGTQSVSATTDGSGIAKATLKLNQKVGTYTLVTSFAGDGLYTNSSVTTSFVIGNNPK